ncbi:alcohol dehydrogenase catalytic domain-containing protein [Dictyobacter aurantiacus]|uniref:Alcohol dehydrogenase-like N-terminal domain-containing protein n=1 Tax=Dictyobacter aurantiacus TaxID=1936993 RepID=A0A401ZT78_9CHLR|nr:alcohol dehydrogenase catalytic domain-containing protein [Dictyobacter aurantiacus]GCE09984.1 hypothetical protein KDAU_73130 [Dictyobacter aurantiacus]
MKAIVYDAPRRFSYRDVPMPEIEPDEVRIRVRACGICGTDLHIHEGEFLAQFPRNPYEIFQKQLTITGSFAQTHCFDRALAYLESRKVKVNEMVTHAFALEEYGKALETLRSRQGIKTIIQFR